MQTFSSQYFRYFSNAADLYGLIYLFIFYREMLRFQRESTTRTVVSHRTTP